MGSFSDYVNNEQNKKSVDRKETPSNDDLEKKINEYGKLSSEELMSEFVRLTIEKKKNGELTNSELNNIKNTILPFLNNDQKLMLEKVLNMVDHVW